MAKVNVHVTYCGGCGYKSKYENLKSDLLDIFGSEIDVNYFDTQNITVEVTVNGKLVHSKKNGDGYVDSKAKFDKITNAIEAALKA